VYVAGEGREFQAFPLETPFDVMQRWRSTARARMVLRSSSIGGHSPAGTFAADVRRYLSTVTAMPDYRGRVYDMQRWLQVFDTRRSLAIQPHEIRAQRDAWLLHGPKRRYDTARKTWIDVDAPLAESTVNHRLRALENFYTVMFPREDNPVKHVPEADEPEPQDRSVPYALIEIILSAMPDRGQGLPNQPRSTVSKSKARLRLMAYSGLTQRQIMQLTPEDIDLTTPAVRLARRKKGKGAAGGWRPLPDDAREALEQFLAADAGGRFSRDALRQSWQRACQKLGLPRIRPYDLRHSYLTDLAAFTRDEHAVKELAGHADIRSTYRYTRGSMPVRLVQALKLFKRGEIAP